MYDKALNAVSYMSFFIPFQMLQLWCKKYASLMQERYNFDEFWLYHKIILAVEKTDHQYKMMHTAA